MAGFGFEPPEDGPEPGSPDDPLLDATPSAGGGLTGGNLVGSGATVADFAGDSSDVLGPTQSFGGQEIGGGLGTSVGFPPTPIGPAICGFGIPGFDYAAAFAFKIRVPSFDFPPSIFFAIALKCDLTDPLDTDFGFGGGRSPTGPDPDLDPEFDA